MSRSEEKIIIIMKKIVNTTYGRGGENVKKTNTRCTDSPQPWRPSRTRRFHPARGCVCVCVFTRHVCFFFLCLPPRGRKRSHVAYEINDFHLVHCKMHSFCRARFALHTRMKSTARIRLDFLNAPRFPLYIAVS